MKLRQTVSSCGIGSPKSEVIVSLYSASSFIRVYGAPPFWNHHSSQWMEGTSTANSKEHHTVVVLFSFGHSSLSFISDGIVLWGNCRLTTCWWANRTWPQTQSIQDAGTNVSKQSVSSLVEAGTMNDLRELAKRGHCINRFHSLKCSMSRLLSSIKSSIKILIQCTNSGEELSQCRNTLVFTLQVLPVVSQTN